MTIPDEMREALADWIEDAMRALTPDLSEEGRARARSKALQGPMLMVMIIRIDPDHPKITASDQWLAAGCALQNFLLAAEAEGVGVAIRSGAFMAGEALRRGLGLAPQEAPSLLLVLGTAADPPKAKPKPGFSALHSVLARTDAR
jgi:nitroreductase